MDHQNCEVEPFEKPVKEEALSQAATAYLAVQGMGCPRCALRVRNGLLKLDGVFLAEVALERGTALVTYDPQRLGSAELLQAVSAAGDDGRHFYRAILLDPTTMLPGEG